MRIYVIRYQYKSLPHEDIGDYPSATEAEHDLAEYRLSTQGDAHAKWWLITRHVEEEEDGLHQD